jgi:hypothetical protein
MMSEENHIMVREKLGAFSVIPIRNEGVPIWKTHGRYRKQMKCGYSKTLYHQRNKDETIVSVIKRLFGEHIRSRHVMTQNRELSLRCIAYNMHRLTNLVVRMMISTEPGPRSRNIKDPTLHTLPPDLSNFALSGRIVPCIFFAFQRYMVDHISTD